MKLICKNCGTPIEAAQINVQTMTAVCNACNAVFPFDHADLISKSDKRRKRDKRTEITQPDGVTVDKSDDDLTLRLRLAKLLSPQQWGAIAGLSVTASVLLFATGATAFSGRPELLGGSALSGLIVLGLMYILAMSILNTLLITVDDHALHRRHRPLPGRTRTITRDAIDHITVTPVNRQAPHGEHYVRVVFNTGRTLNLMAIKRDAALYVGQQLEQALFPETDVVDVTHDDLFYAEDVAYQLTDDGELIPVDDHDAAQSANRG